MRPDELKQLIQSDSQASMLFNDRQDEQCAIRCTSIAPTIRRVVPAIEVQRAASLSGAWARIVLAREKLTTPDSVKGIAITFLSWIDINQPLNFDLPEVRGMAKALQDAGLVTAAEMKVIVALGDTPQLITGADVEMLRINKVLV